MASLSALRPHMATGQDIHFEDTGAIRSLLGVAVEGADLGFIGNQISSHFGLSTGVVSDDISFDAATGQIRSVAGNLPNFVTGFQIQVTGAILNNGTFTVIDTPTPGFVVQVAEGLLMKRIRIPFTGYTERCNNQLGWWH